MKGLRTILKAITPGIVIYLVLLFAFGCQTPKYEVENVDYYVVDSVWILPPGHQSTMQFDPLYCHEHNSKVSCTRRPTKVGDTIFFYYIKVVKDSI